MPTELIGSRRHRLIAATLFVLVLILGYWRMVPYVCGSFHDDGIYVITAKALAQGQGYRLTYLPNSPLQTKYPILYPALLAMVWKIWPTFPDNLLLMKWLTLLCGAGSVSLAYLYLSRFGYFPRSVAAIAGLICATSPLFLYYATQALSEAPFALLAILALWAFEAQGEGPVNRGTRQFLLGILLALPFLCRSVGVTLVCAALLVQYYRGRPLRWMALGMAVVMLPWFIWMAAGLGAWNRDPISGYYTDYVSWWTTMNGALAFRIIWNNIINFLVSIATMSVGGFAEIFRAMDLWGSLFLIIFIGSIPLIALTTELPTWRLLPFFLLAYFLLILVWPWHPMRFLVPIMPFLFAYFFEGLSNFFQRWKIRARYLFPIGLLIVAGNLTLLYTCAKQANQFGYPYVGMVKHPAPWAAYKDVFQWLKIHSQPEDVIASMEDPMVFLYTGRKAIRPFKITPALLGYGTDLQNYGSPEDLVRTFKAYKVRYLVLFPIHAFDQEQIDALIDALPRRYPGFLRQVYAGKDKRFAIYELPPLN